VDFPEISRSCRRSWAEICDYYESSLDLRPCRRLLWEFSVAAGANPRFDRLVTVGRLACILIYRDDDCLSERGWLLIGGVEDHMVIGFFQVANYDPKELVRFTDVPAAMRFFEATIVGNDFIRA
jgi:hypothetical protein